MMMISVYQQGAGVRATGPNENIRESFFFFCRNQRSDTRVRLNASLQKATHLTFFTTDVSKSFFVPSLSFAMASLTFNSASTLACRAFPTDDELELKDTAVSAPSPMTVIGDGLSASTLSASKFATFTFFIKRSEVSAEAAKVSGALLLQFCGSAEAGIARENKTMEAAAKLRDMTPDLGCNHKVKQ